MLAAWSFRHARIAVSATSRAGLHRFRTAASLTWLRCISGWKSIQIRPPKNFLSNSRRAIPEFIASVICVPCGKRVQVWRREAIQRLIFKLQEHTQDVSSNNESKMVHGQSEAELLTPSASDCALFKIDKILINTPRLTAAGNIVHEAFGNKIT